MFATPLFGAATVIVVGLAGASALSGARFLPLLILIAGTIVLARAGTWLAHPGVLTAPLLRARGVNLEASRPGEMPRVWLAAHLDSKSQPLPTLVRSAGLIVESFGAATAIVASALVAGGFTVHDALWAVAGVLTLGGAVPVVLSMVGTRSPGALDNASGVAAVLAAARLAAGHPGIGVLITDAEELGLAGARAWARKDAGAVLNCDGVDDSGVLTIMYSGSPCPPRLERAITDAAKSNGAPVEFTRMFPGVLTDSVAFADAGAESLTFSRGAMASFARVHSMRDDLKHLRGDGIAPMAALLAETAKRLTA